MRTRHAVRVVLLDDEERVAVIWASKSDYYKVPGGGIEEDETEQQAAIRETFEETGCNCKIVRGLGVIETDIIGWDLRDVSHGFVAELVGEKGEPHYDDYEKERGFAAEWYDSLQDAILMIENHDVEDDEAALLQKRDLDFLKRAARA